MAATVATGIADAVREQDVVRKVIRRIVWILFLMYVASYIDRINISYAALAMNKALGLSATEYGLANSLFYGLYLLCEVPSNLMLVRFGARKWLARIMISWGIIAAGMALVEGPVSLAIVRTLLGMAEAGFVPGVLLYISYWIPNSHRARVMAMIMMSQPFTLMFASPVSGWLLGFDHILGLANWRGMFIIETLPSVILGAACLWLLTDRPSEAKWLSAAERGVLQKAIDRDAGGGTGKRTKTPWKEMGGTVVISLAIAYFCLVTSLNTYATWAPQIIKAALGAGGAFRTVGNLGAIPPFFALLLMPLWSARADRKNERFRHTAVMFALTAIGWSFVISSLSPAWQMVGLSLAVAGAFTAMALFWAFATSYLSTTGRPVSIGIIATTGILGSAVSPTIIGVLRDVTGSFNAGLWYAIVLLILGGIALAVVRTRGSEGASRHSKADSAIANETA